MLHRIAKPALTAALLLAASCAHATVCHVKVNASGEADGSSWDNAMWLTDAVNPNYGCTDIRVAAGVYYPAGTGEPDESFELRAGVSLTGGYPADGGDTRDLRANLTVLSGDIDQNDCGGSGCTGGIATSHTQIAGSNSYHVVRLLGAGAVLDGVVVSGGSATIGGPESSEKYGGGVWISADATVRQSRIVGNRAAGAGGGVWVTAGNATLSHLLVEGNNAYSGGGIRVTDAANATLRQSTVAGNSASIRGSGIENRAQLTLRHVSIVANTSSTATSTGGLFTGGSGAATTLIASVIADSTGAQADCFVESGLSFSAQDSRIEDGSCIAAGVNGNSSGDPLLGALADNGGATFTHLPQTGSPLLDAAACSADPRDATDQRGVARPEGAACDIGAVEREVILGGGSRCHVRASATGANDGTSWANGYTDLQTALHDASCTEVRVAAGVYKPVVPADPANVTTEERATSFAPQAGTTLLGGYPAAGGSMRDPDANPTILSGDIDSNDANGDGNDIAETYTDATGSNSHHVVSINGEVWMEGFVVTAGITANANSIDPDYTGGGIQVRGGTVQLRKLRISGNSARFGGGLALTDGSGANVAASGLVVQGNLAYFGGGGVMNSENTVLTLLENTIAANHASQYGGGIQGFGTLTLRNSTATGNYANTGGGLYSDGSASIANSTFSGNSAGNVGGGIAGFGFSLSHVTVVGNSGTGGLYLSWTGNTATASVIAGNSGGDCFHNSGGYAFAATSSLLGIAGCGVVNGENGNLAGTPAAPLDPLLGALANNGGPTPTHLPQAGSPVIDAVTPCSTNPAVASDQRGLARPQGTACDMGAVEVVNAGTTPPQADLRVSIDANPASAGIGEEVLFAIVASNAGGWYGSPGATLASTPPATLTGVAWACNQSQSSASCPSDPADSSGIGALDVSIDLPVGRRLRYDLIATVAGTVGAEIETTATLAAPVGIPDPNAANNTATAEVLVVQTRIFGDGFEAGGSGYHRSPAAQAARHD